MSFSPISHEKWIEKIKKELKKDDLSSFDVAITPRISVNPFFGRKPKENKGSRVEKDWQNKQVYYSSQLDNKLLIENLVGGINSIEIHVDQIQNDWTTLLKDVIFEYINLSFVIEVELTSDELKRQLSSLDFDPTIIDKKFILRSDDVAFVEQLKEHFTFLINELDSCSTLEERELLFASFRIDRKMSSKMIAEIALSDAIEILSINLCRGFGMKERCLSMHAYCGLESNETLERNYIDLSTKALNAALGNYDAIVIAPASADRASFHHRISRNIHHLLKEESVLHQSRTAYKGAYQVTEISHKIADEIWTFVHT